ncbi:MAG: tRNA glutamyl-Q(34) synthetase GluQRS [Marinicella sp.]
MPAAAGYVGRFAPSPTGDLHFGSLVAAIVSYCQAKANNGNWLVRIEDVDETRVVTGAAEQIIKTLKNFGMESDGPIIYQTDPSRQAAYQQAFQQLQQQKLIYPCSCTRAVLKDQTIYPGQCRIQPADTKQAHSIRLKVPDQTIEFNDLIQGQQQQNLKQHCGDFNIKRKDGLFAYQLAVVVDDADQGITEVVRGIDIMDSTPRQIYLNQILHLNQPQYAHFPVVVNSDDNKLSKQNHAKAISNDDPFATTQKVLAMLGQKIPILTTRSQSELLNFAINNWNIDPLKEKAKISVSTSNL